MDMREQTEQSAPFSAARTVIVGAGEAGLRLDTALSRICPEVSRTAVQRLIREGLVSLRGRPAKAGVRVEEGMSIGFTIPPATPSPLTPQDIPLDILYEDDHLVVVNKPPGMVVHPAPGHAAGTLVNALLHHCPTLSGIGGVQRPGIVHRLDKGTSGVMVATKNDAAHRRLAADFKARRVEKTYLALVWDNVPGETGSIELPIGRDRKDRQKMSARTAAPRESLTEYRVLRRWGPFTLLEVFPRTGRTHQIRVHLAHAKHPIVGDPVYGRRTEVKRLPREWRTALASPDRPLLHAWRIAFRHPADGRRMEFIAPPPADLACFLPEGIREG